MGFAQINWSFFVAFAAFLDVNKLYPTGSKDLVARKPLAKSYLKN